MTTTTREGVGIATARRMAIKVPEITIYFWIIKLMTTAMGEAGADYLATVVPGGVKGALVLTSAALAVSLLVQLLVRRYVASIYWTVVVMVSVAGTLITDTIVQRLGVTHLQATVLFTVVLGAVFGLWYASERTLSIHSIDSFRREAFYWTTVLVTFALGTAAGDLTAFALGWGFPASIALFTTALLAAAVAHLRFGAAPIPAFWFAYVLTRPVGATTADYLALPKDIGALGLGLWQVTIAFLIGILALVAYLAITRRDTPTES